MVIVSLDSKLSQNWCGPKARSRRTLTTWCECKPGVGCAAIGAARAVRRLVPRARLAPACPSARTARKGLPMPGRASHCAPPAEARRSPVSCRALSISRAVALDQRLVQGRQSIHSTSRRSRRLPSISRATLRRQSRRWACPSDLRRAQETRCHRGVPANASRRGYARCVARLLEPDETLLSRVRHHLRPDRAPSSGTGEDRTADDGVFRSDLPRAPPKRTRPHSSARRICRCSNGTHRCRPPQPILATHSRTNQAYCLEPSFAARCARHA